jgi:histidyl-tRNA synthetase
MGIPDREEFARRIDAYVAVLGQGAVQAGVLAVHELRKAGFSVETRYTPASLKSQMKTADKFGASRVIIIGEDELSRGEATVRDMRTKEQTSVKIDELVSHLKS